MWPISLYFLANNNHLTTNIIEQSSLITFADSALPAVRLAVCL